MAGGAVGRVKLSALTAKEIQKWKQDFTARAEPDPISQHSARVSVNSVIRSCKSLWSPKKVLKHLELDVPASPFKEVEYEKAPPRKYSPSFDVAVLLQAAQAELALQFPEQYKILLLALAAGLRRKECDLLEWSAFKWQRNVIAIEATKYLSPKTPGSAQEIKLHPDTMAIFKGFHAKRTGSFVIEADAEPRVGLLYAIYRCEKHFRPLTEWLKADGVSGHTPLHSMRKEFGSIINSEHEIHAASRALRHSSVTVTDMHYTDNRADTAVSLKEILGGGSKVVPMVAAPGQPFSKAS